MTERSRARILVVEDEGIVSLELQQRLLDLGYEIAGSTSTGEDGIELALSTRPDLVLMDIRLAGRLDGVEAAERIRSTAKIPVIFLTAYADEGTVKRAKLAEPFGYILKPFQERELWSAIEMALYKHRAERRLELSERHYAATLDSIGDAVITLDADGNITLLNRVAETLTGLVPSEAIGQHAARMLRLVDLERGVTVELPESTSSPGNPEGRRDVGLERRDGRVARVSLRVSPIAGANGDAAGRVVVLEDVTRSRSLEEQLLQAQKMEAVGRLAGGVAHDFNNMLTIILSGSEILADEITEGSTRDIVTEIIEAAQRCASLTRQLLIFSRKQVSQTALLDLNAEVAETKKMLLRVIGEDIRLSTVAEGGLPHVRLDPVHLQQLVMNLAVNARDAMPNGGALTIETSSLRVDADEASKHPGTKPGIYVVLSVIDTGTGMDASTLSHVFEPFFTTKEKGKGTGLGLATVYEIVRQAGGFITIQSAIGKGSAFRIHLPAAEGTPRAQELREPRHTRTSYGSERVLLVEDEEALRTMMCQSLQRSGYTVLEARNAGEALLICEQSTLPIHIMVTDIVLPMMSGVQLGKRLRDLHPELAILYMSGYAEELERERQSLGDAFLQKPFTADALMRKVREVLEAHRRLR